MDDLDLLVLGDCNPDLVLRGPDLHPRFGQAEQPVDEARLAIGGSGAITACGAARLGLRTALVGVVGDDVLGHWLLEELAGRGVDVGGCVVDRVRPTGMTVVLSEPGDRAMFTAVGTVAALRAEADRPRPAPRRQAPARQLLLSPERPPAQPRRTVPQGPPGRPQHLARPELGSRRGVGHRARRAPSAHRLPASQRRGGRADRGGGGAGGYWRG